MTAPTTPAIAGAGQSIQRPGSWTDAAQASGPIELMIEASRSAAEDAGAAGLLERLDWVGVARGFWHYTNPGEVLARHLGSPDAHTCLSAMSGTSPQELVGIAAERIRRGEISVALVVGGEARWSAQRLKRAGEEPRWITELGAGTPEMIGTLPSALIDEVRELGGASTAYALFEDSLRAARGETVDTHRHHIAALWSRLSDVAAANDFAWDQTAKTATAIREPSADNRMIAFPYAKAHVANNTVDMASALILCSQEAARDAGVTDDRLVYPHAATTGHDTWQAVNRSALHEVPALRAAGHHALELAGVGIEEIEHVDLYACFPSIVQMSGAALGLDLMRPLTLTGGLGFAGAAIANSTGHALAAMVPRVRSGGWGFVHANGGSTTKHAFGVYSSRPPADDFRLEDSQDRVSLDERARADASASGTVEAATVIFDREGPSHVVATALTADGARFFTRSEQHDVITQAMTEGLVGAAAPPP